MSYPRLFGAVGVCIMVVSMPLKASVVYTYTGNNYDYVTAPYTTSMQITASIELPSVLTPLANQFDDGFLNPISFSISDGVNVITESDFLLLKEFSIWTNASGEITGWVFNVFKGDNQFLTAGDPVYRIMSSTKFNVEQTEAFECLTPMPAPFYCGLGNNELLGSVSTLNYGAWTVQSTAVPIPTALWLFGSGLVGLVGIARHMKTV